MSIRMRLSAVCLALLMVWEIAAPSVAYAMGGGPSQPEVQSFQPASADNMVNLFTGDFSYNIPLMDVEGYPINLFYSGGVTMDQEASWVGLGWNINPGTVDRTVRGIPDDFNGDESQRDMHLRTNLTVGVSTGSTTEFLGNDFVGASIGTTISLNNYNGFRFENSVGLSLRSAAQGKSAFTAGLGLTSGSHSGLRLQPSVGFEFASYREHEEGGKGGVLGFNVGLAIDSRKGMTDLSFGVYQKNLREDCHTGKPVGGGGLGQIASSSYPIGQSTYTPRVSMPMANESISMNFTIGSEVLANHAGLRYGGFVSRQRLKENTVKRKSYGYLYLQNAETEEGSVMDINREKDGPYDPGQAALPMANLTNDIYSVSGQGISGSYRAFRSQVGMVRDESNSCTGGSGSLGVELGAGSLVHVGGDALLNYMNSWSGRWTANNMVAPSLKFRSNTPGVEGVYFREANEPVVDADDRLFEEWGAGSARRFTLQPVSPRGTAVRLLSELSNDGDAPLAISSFQQRKRQARTQIFNYLTLADVRNGLGLEGISAGSYTTATAGENVFFQMRELRHQMPSHHIGQIAITGAEGQRYVYGLPVYNNRQTDVTFAIGAPVDNRTDDLINYAPNDASMGNRAGKDQYYSRTTTSPYAYSYLLTSIVSPDYSDVDDIKGPSDGDLGSYTRFEYLPVPFRWNSVTKVVTDYSWRTPAVNGNAPKALYDRGLRAVKSDDKGSYSYGEKEVFYLRTIQSKNRIAVFDLSEVGERLDACPLKEDGTIDPDPLGRLRFLKTITLYDKASYLAWVGSTYRYTNDAPPEPIMQVHFDYQYLLCKGTPNSTALDQKKLTLVGVYFTYGRSGRGVTTPYTFTYGDLEKITENPSYDQGSQDRWGMVKPDLGSPMAERLALDGNEFGTNVDYLKDANAEFPYAEQNAGLADALAGAWCLKHIGLPSGGSIDVSYESDDYAFVQDKPACRMMRILGTEQSPGGQLLFSGGIGSKLYFEIPESVDPELFADDMRQRMFEGQDMLYFRAKVRYTAPGMEDDYVSGYAKIVHADRVDGFADLGYVDLEEVPIDEEGGPPVSPIKRAALQYARLNYPEQVYAPPGSTDGDNLTADVIAGIAQSVIGFVEGIPAFFQGPNKQLDGNVPTQLEGGWIRLTEPTHRKKGGGHRVARIAVNDAWGEMGTSAGSESRSYVQRYDYHAEDGIASSGVAAYEPMSGADENPLRRPVYPSEHWTNTLAADERFYQEQPFGESFFPGALVGYSRVTVNSEVADPEEQGTGRVVNEFYTAKDFPVRTSRTTIQQVQRKSNPGALALMGINGSDYMYTSQGFVVETNDMHGKPKAVTVFAEGAEDGAVSSITYEYDREADGSLRNKARVVYPDGTFADDVTIGRQYDIIPDIREFGSESQSCGAAINLDVIQLGPFVIPLPPILVKASRESTRYRSSALVKHIHRFGLIRKVIKMDRGSTIAMENVAYDAETGRVLVTRSENEFHDPVYTMEFPAYWYYRGMAPAYRNMGMQRELVCDASGVAQLTDAPSYFTPGDVLQLGTGQDLGWVAAVDAGSVRLMNDVGNAIVGTNRVRVLRSGYRNMQSVPMMTITTLTDPLLGLASNTYVKVLQAKGMEYRDHWRSDCACTAGTGNNVFRDNRSGAWRLSKEWVWLAQRSRSVQNNNTDIRRDGVFTSFSPLYRLRSGKWEMAPAGWTTSREVTQYANNGQVQEERDALDIPSSATYSHKGTLMNAKAVNAVQKEVGFDSFEADDPANCADRHFRFSGGVFRIEEGAGHTGRRFLRVGAGKEARMRSALLACPVVDCNYTIASEPITDGRQLTASGTGLPVIFEPMVIEGSPLIMPTPNGISVTSATSGWEVRVTMRGSDGCPQEITLHD